MPWSSLLVAGHRNTSERSYIDVCLRHNGGSICDSNRRRVEPPRQLNREQMMPKNSNRMHVVRAMLRVHELTRAGSSLDLNIFAGGRKIGRVVIGRGSLYWYGGGRHRSKRVSWTRFAEMMDELA